MDIADSRGGGALSALKETTHGLMEDTPLRVTVRTCVYSGVIFQVAGSGEALAAPLAAEWLFASMSSHVNS